MKSASKFEKFAARSWNLLNEGKPFTPIFTVGTMVLFHLGDLGSTGSIADFLLSFLTVLPLFIIYFIYDFPLFLRNYLWIPLIVFMIVWPEPDINLLLFAAGLYFFFTVFFWGTLYYHLRIGTSWLNFTRFWKLVLKNSDSTSGNAQEQLPKVFLLLSLWELSFGTLTAGANIPFFDMAIFYGFVLLFAFILHRYLFDWKPKAYESYTKDDGPEVPENGLSDKVIVIVIDGMRKERFYEANTPFLDQLKENGTEYLNMETLYPARTVVCFSSMFTGTYPFEHGIKSNMVYKLGVNTETIFDSLRKVGKRGRLLGIAHLVDAMGSDVETVTAVMHKDKADTNMLARARKIMDEQDPDLFIVQMIGTDQVGHSRGVLYDDYIEKIEEADALIQEFVQWLESEGKMENTTLVVCADHGQADGIGGHGHLDEGERFVPFFMHGPHIAKGVKVQEKHSLVSLAPTISYLMGAPYPASSRGKVLMDAIKAEKDENVIE
ncbi:MULTISPECIES: alkaline phosphatase family protein [unclassified Bacillus (in: firmicutes)]|uniref:alkaline phosphatase family protein n=1 Tax=unclassified Bacillus (in: firmicutes) TaxID=185979 RepID=UPI001BE73CB2|nr:MULTISPECIES: alkaline phosphatase family protein [unclassified Bacillus (in: firmicutes)]MBT2638558.1 alkaline phosphatase family protein [Bacillus sp. ISL-39]MBT2660563.1 alkaline phosphatase family protein [Bacillus sp. ISL-45]